VSEVVTVRFGDDKISIPSYIVRDFMLKNGYVPEYAVLTGVVDVDRDLLGDPHEIWERNSNWAFPGWYRRDLQQ